ncbi:MAG: ribonuclease R, partial [Prevotella sp.]|nr:ribonuclease R [Prevotella sp.]
ASGRNSVLPDGSDKPIFVAERNSLFALNGDKVRITMMARRRNHIREAQVVEIIQRKTEQFVGRLQIEDGMAYLLPLEPMACNIFIPQGKLNKGKNGDRVVVKVLKWPDAEHRSIVAEVVDVLGPQGDNTAEMHAILAQFGLPYKYPEAVEEAANKISDEITEADLAEREDFRDVWTCTIDPHDAKDFDDALSIRQLPGGQWEVGVHIADVSHYVTEGSVIDKEAQQRATSVYLVDRTIPMLPERLCNYICSLRPNEDKLAYSVIFTLDDEAVVKNYRIVHTVINSNRRYAYEEVQAVIDATARLQAKGTVLSKKEREEAEATVKGEPYAEQLLTLNRLAHKLRERRFQNGSVRFEREELRFDIDETGKPTRCYFKKSLAANQLIEEFMLLANRTVAEHVGKVPAPRGGAGAKGKKPAGKTLPYRIHDSPDPQKMETLREFVAKFGHKLKSTGTKSATARAMNALMDEVEGRPEGNAIQMVALRAMMKAKYSTHNIGHFGLAFEYYTHFTSPIRRYPDTMVHRLLTRYENGGRSANQDKYEELCEHSSEMEQLAAQAERESIKYKMVEYMGQFLGEEFDAH